MTKVKREFFHFETKKKQSHLTVIEGKSKRKTVLPFRKYGLFILEALLLNFSLSYFQFEDDDFQTVNSVSHH